jgi:hypothetical protein
MHDGDKVRGAAAIDAFPGLGKTTTALTFARQFHRREAGQHGSLTADGNEHLPVCRVSLGAGTTIKALNQAILGFYAHPATGRYGKSDLTAKELRQLLPEQDAFLWEGHYRTLVDTFEMPKWTEPLRPSLIFLQSCLALNPEDAALLFDRGAVAVVGTPNRTYSGSGGALTLAYAFALPPLVEALLPLPLPARIALAVAIVAPLGFVMGMPFPQGLQRAGRGPMPAPPFYWGLNGIMSVVGSSATMLLAVTLGFRIAMLAGVACYALAAVASTELGLPEEAPRAAERALPRREPSLV